jgi:hypothetical protein
MMNQKLMLEWMWTKRSEELSYSLGIICCSYLVKSLHQPKFCLHLEIPTEIPTDKYQYMVYQYQYRPSCQYKNGIQLLSTGALPFQRATDPRATTIGAMTGVAGVAPEVTVERANVAMMKLTRILKSKDKKA